MTFSIGVVLCILETLETHETSRLPTSEELYVSSHAYSQVHTYSRPAKLNCLQFFGVLVLVLVYTCVHVCTS